MSIYPKYMKSKSSGAIIKFVSIDKGEVVEPGNAAYNIGYSSSSFRHHTDQNIWKDVSQIWLENMEKAFKENIESLTYFQTLPLKNSSSTLTKVPHGYVMTSHSGHQLFIKENTKETL